MASKPFFDPRRGVWVCKYKPDPLGAWVRQPLCKHDKPWSASSPPRKPSREALERHRHFADIEYNARHGISAAPRRARPLAEYLEAYCEAHGLVARPGSNVLLRRIVRYFLEFADDRGVGSVQAVTRAHCRDFLERRLKTVKLSTLESERGILMGAWTRAVQDELIAKNPWEDAPVPGKAAESSVTFWLSEEIARIVKVCRGWQADLALVLANTGIRIGTAVLMEWDWIDWDAGRVKIPSGEGIKTPYVHVLGQGARDVLERRCAMSKSAYVFPGTRSADGPANYHTARYAIVQAIARARVRPGTPHDLRHSYGRALALKGVPVTVIQRQLGHSTLAMTMRYVATEAEHSAQFVGDFSVG